MKYELGFIEEIVKERIIEPSGASRAGTFDNMTVMFKEEVSRIKTAWRNEVFASDNERIIENYIQNHQKVLIELTNLILSHLDIEEEIIKSETEIDSYLQLYKEVYQCLEDLLSFIEKYFTKYFDQEMTIPDNYRWLAIRDCKEIVPQIQEKLISKRVDKSLLSLALYPLDRFIQSGRNAQTTYKRLIFKKELIRELDELSKTEFEGRLLDEQLRMLLLYLDYNVPRSLNYATEYINHLVNKADTMAGRMEKLAFVQKYVNQAQVKPGFSYTRDHKSLKEQLSAWIDEEVFYAEKRQQLSLNLRLSPQAEFLATDFKLKTDLSVPQLAYFIRILMETGVIQNKNIQEVARFFSRNLKTKRAENISSESFRTKYYNTEDSARMHVKDLLIGLLNKARKH